MWTGILCEYCGIPTFITLLVLMSKHININYVLFEISGVEFIGIVEYAPFQRIPKKKKKKDPKCGTIESDPVYQEFFENLTKEPEMENIPKLEYSYPITDGKCAMIKIIIYSQLSLT